MTLLYLEGFLSRSYFTLHLAGRVALEIRSYSVRIAVAPALFTLLVLFSDDGLAGLLVVAELKLFGHILFLGPFLRLRH